MPRFLAIPDCDVASAASMRRIRAQHWGAALATTALVAVAHRPGGLPAVAFFALFPWFASPARTLTSALSGLLAGTAAAILSAPGVFDALGSLGYPRPGRILLMLCGAVVTFGIPYALLGFVHATVRQARLAEFVLILSTGTLAIDLARSSAAYPIPWGLLGETQAHVPGFAQLAAIGGVPLISVVLVLGNALLARILTAERGDRVPFLRAAALLGGALLAVGLGGARACRWVHGDPAPGAAPLVALLVQPGIPRGERWSESLQRANLSKLSRLVIDQNARPGPVPSFIALPENSISLRGDPAPQLRADIQQLVDDLALPLAIGVTLPASELNGDAYRSALAWFKPGDSAPVISDKTRLVPLVEGAIPVLARGAWSRWMGAPASGPRAREGPAPGPGSPFGVVPILCFEILYSRLVSGRVRDDTTAILHAADDHWGSGSAITEAQARAAIFRAIESRTSVLRVTQGGRSAVIDPFGTVIAELREEEEGALLARAPRRAVRPLISDAFALGSLGLIGGALGCGATAITQRGSRACSGSRHVVS